MNNWTTVSKYITKIPSDVEARTESLKSSFADNALPATNISEGQIVYNKTTQVLYLRNYSEFEELNSIIKSRLFYRNLVITNLDTAITTKLSITADFISCAGYAISNFSKTLDTTLGVGGINRLDTGTFSANTWYAIWLIVDTGASEPYGQTPTFDTILSASFTAPTLTWGAYDKAIRIGAVRTKSGSALFREFQQVNDTTYYLDTSYVNTPTDVDCKVLIGGTATSWTAVTNLNLSLPYTTGSVYTAKEILAVSNVTAGTNPISYFRPKLATSTSIVGIILNTAIGFTSARIPCSSTGLEYKVAGTATPTVSLNVVGYVDTI